MTLYERHEWQQLQVDNFVLRAENVYYQALIREIMARLEQLEQQVTDLRKE